MPVLDFAIRNHVGRNPLFSLRRGPWDWGPGGQPLADHYCVHVGTYLPGLGTWSRYLV